MYPALQFWALQGHINWSLIIYPLLCPALSALYEKTAGKTKPHALLHVNTNIVCELSWFINHVKHSAGIHFLEASEWTIHDDVDTLKALHQCIRCWHFGSLVSILATIGQSPQTSMRMESSFMKCLPFAVPPTFCASMATCNTFYATQITPAPLTSSILCMPSPPITASSS